VSEYLTASITILGGFIVFVLGQIVVKFFIEPIHEQSKTIGEIAYSLIFYANLYSNPGNSFPDERKEAEEKLRSLASLLISRTHIIKPYGLFEEIKIVPKRNSITEASKNLILLSNSIFLPQPDIKVIIKARKDIESLLDIKTRTT
jgi:hypothetical protein